AIMDLFPVHERGIAMGIKQMGLTLGGIASAIATCGLVVALPVALSWRPLGRLNDAPIARATSAAREGGASAWSWARRPAILAFFASGLVLGMVQAAVLSYLPLYTIQALGFDTIGAGFSSPARRRAARCRGSRSAPRAIAGSPSGARCGWR